MAFASVLGHERIRALLSRAVASERVPPALLFTGPSGVGKKTLALAVGRALLCERRDGDSCGVCAPCSRAQRGIHPDLVLLAPATAVIKIDQVRDLVREIAGRPFEARARAFVIDQADTLTEEAANALLKSLEEPPPSSHVFLVTAAPQALLPTIRSRCQTLRLGPLTEAVIESRLAAGGASPDEARLRASLSGGSLGAALAFESETYRALREDLLALLETVGTAGPLERMAAADKLADLEDVPAALTALRALLRDAMALRAGVAPESLLNADVAARLLEVARGRVGERAGVLAEFVGETREALRGNANVPLSMDLLLEAFAG